MESAVISKVINNAGIVSRGLFVDTPVSEARKLLEVNYLGAYNVTQASPVLWYHYVLEAHMHAWWRLLIVDGAAVIVNFWEWVMKGLLPYFLVQTFLPIIVKEGQRKRGADRPSIIMVGSFAGKVRFQLSKLY